MTQFSDDLDEILQRSRSDLESLAEMNLFVTGGTGFVGTWLTQSWLYAHERLKGSGHLTLLTRRADHLLASRPELAATVSVVQGDIRTFSLKSVPRSDLIIHAATPARESLNLGNPSEMLGIIIDGQRHLLERIIEHSRPRLLFTSSGAVYGRLREANGPVTEESSSAPDPLDPKSAYHEGKRMAELLLSIAHSAGVVDPVVARLFAFVGPHLPIDEHFAVGNFIRDATAGRPITLTGDGSPVRSYQYPTDLMTWLWRLALSGQPARAYNVGSDHGLPLAEVARAVASRSHRLPIVLAQERQPDREIDYYVPNVDRCKNELGLENKVGLDEAIRRTLRWHTERT